MRSNKRSFQQKLGTLSQRCPLIAQVNVIALTPSGKSMVYQKAWQNADSKESFALCKFNGADNAVTQINLFTLSLLSKWLWLSVIKALNTLKLFYSHSQDLHSRPGFNSFKGKHQMSLRSSIHSLGRCMLFFIWLLKEDFTICNALNWTTQPIANLNSTIRWWMRFRQHL